MRRTPAENEVDSPELFAVNVTAPCILCVPIEKSILSHGRTTVCVYARYCKGHTMLEYAFQRCPNARDARWGTLAAAVLRVPPSLYPSYLRSLLTCVPAYFPTVLNVLLASTIHQATEVMALSASGYLPESCARTFRYVNAVSRRIHIYVPFSCLFSLPRTLRGCLFCTIPGTSK